MLAVRTGLPNALSLFKAVPRIFGKRGGQRTQNSTEQEQALRPNVCADYAKSNE